MPNWANNVGDFIPNFTFSPSRTLSHSSVCPRRFYATSVLLCREREKKCLMNFLNETFSTIKLMLLNILANALRKLKMLKTQNDTPSRITTNHGDDDDDEHKWRMIEKRKRRRIISRIYVICLLFSTFPFHLPKIHAHSTATTTIIITKPPKKRRKNEKNTILQPYQFLS